MWLIRAKAVTEGLDVHLRRPRRTLAVLALVAAPVAAGVATSPGPAGAAASRTVVIKDFAFKPSAITVSKGTTVTWRFSDGNTRHNVTSKGTRRFKSSGSKATGTHRVTFRKSGLYRYVCSLHFGMKGSVRVR